LIAITRKCQYALRALFYLARQRENGLIPILQIATATKAPMDFLEVILPHLRNARILESRRGCYGGYALAVPPNEISVGTVVRVIDGPLVNLPCLDGATNRRCQDCADRESCEIRRFMREIHEAAAAVLDRTFLSSFSISADGITVAAGADSFQN
jgi:Rrf2 family protein